MRKRRASKSSGSFQTRQREHSEVPGAVNEIKNQELQAERLRERAKQLDTATVRHSSREDKEIDGKPMDDYRRFAGIASDLNDSISLE